MTCLDSSQDLRGRIIMDDGSKDKGFMKVRYGRRGTEIHFGGFSVDEAGIFVHFFVINCWSNSTSSRVML